jgi:hypothetical protein
MNEIDKVLSELKAAQRALDKKVIGRSRLIFGVQIAGVAMIMISVVAWGGIWLSLLGGAIFIVGMLMPKGPESGPDIERLRTVTRQITDVQQLASDLVAARLTSEEATDKLRTILARGTVCQN